MAGSVNQATGLPDFEDGPRIGNLQRVRTIPEINSTIDPGGGVDQAPPGADERPICQVPRNQWY